MKPYRWFAWRPVWTYDRGWVWLRTVWRQHCPPLLGVPGSCWTWDHHVERSNVGTTTKK